MNGSPVILTGLREIAGDYDALICDIWGVLHDGVTAYPPAVDALRRFRKERGKVVLLSNAPRPPDGVERQLQSFGVTADSFDAIVTSGGASRDDLIRRMGSDPLALMHLGPDRDEVVFEGLNVRLVDADAAEVVLCTGLYDDETETPESYSDILTALKARDLPMICANPDIMVPRAGKLIHCAGGIARAYEKLGGQVAYYGKPHRAIYDAALQAAGYAARLLIVGDALETDIAGANGLGKDALMVTGGLHKDELGEVTPENLAALLDRHGMRARAAIEALRW